MSVPMLNNSIARHDFLTIQIPVEVEINEHSGPIMQQMRKKIQSKLRPCQAPPL